VHENRAPARAFYTLGDLLIPPHTLLEDHDFQREKRELSIFRKANLVADASARNCA
jgi:hypothetical protein